VVGELQAAHLHGGLDRVQGVGVVLVGVRLHVAAVLHLAEVPGGGDDRLLHVHQVLDGVAGEHREHPERAEHEDEHRELGCGSALLVTLPLAE